MRQFFTIASRKIGWQRIFLSRTVAWLLVGAVILTALFKFALPMFISTASVKTNMENVLSSWTGRGPASSAIRSSASGRIRC